MRNRDAVSHDEALQVAFHASKTKRRTLHSGRMIRCYSIATLCDRCWFITSEVVLLAAAAAKQRGQAGNLVSLADVTSPHRIADAVRRWSVEMCGLPAKPATLPASVRQRLTAAQDDLLVRAGYFLRADDPPATGTGWPFARWATAQRRPISEVAADWQEAMDSLERGRPFVRNWKAENLVGPLNEKQAAFAALDDRVAIDPSDVGDEVDHRMAFDTYRRTGDIARLARDLSDDVHPTEDIASILIHHTDDLRALADA